MLIDIGGESLMLFLLNKLLPHFDVVDSGGFLLLFDPSGDFVHLQILCTFSTVVDAVEALFVDGEQLEVVQDIPILRVLVHFLYHLVRDRVILQYGGLNLIDDVIINNVLSASHEF